MIITELVHCQGNWVGISKSHLGFPFCFQDGCADPSSFGTTPSKGRAKEEPRPWEGLHIPFFFSSWRTYLSHEIPRYLSHWVELSPSSHP